MEIIKISPQGFCKGVINAIYTLNKSLKDDNYIKPLYMLGGIVHNKHIINAYINKGIKIIKFEDIDNISKGTILITAHGLSNIKKEYIKSKGLNIIDTTCMEVKKIQDVINEKENEGYDVIYYGSSSHPECKAILEDHKKIHLIESIEDIEKLNIKNNKIMFASQTTSSSFEISKIEKILEFRYPQIIKISDICNATKYRQQALIEKAKECDLVLIIGDKLSNNTKMLVNLAKEYTNAIQIENYDELDSIDLSNVKKLGITAGASTPNILVDEIIKRINDNEYIINLEEDDYINYK